MQSNNTPRKGASSKPKSQGNYGIIAKEAIHHELEAMFLGIKDQGEVISIEPAPLNLYSKEQQEQYLMPDIRGCNGCRFALVKNEEVMGVGITHPGFSGQRQNASNEDDFHLGTSRIAVADGVGGLPGGAEASKTLTEALGRQLERSIADIVEDVHFALHAIDIPMLKSPLKPSTTLVAAELKDGIFTVHWAGDSRALLFNEYGQLQFISKDDIAFAGAQDYERQENLDGVSRNLISNSIGAGTDEYTLHKAKIPAMQGDYLMLVSDGVTDNMNSRMLEHYMKHCIQTKVSFHEIPLKLLRYLTDAQKKDIRPRTENDPKPAKSDAITIVLQKVL